MYNLLLTGLMIDSVLIIIAVLMQPAKQDDAMSALSGGSQDLFSQQKARGFEAFMQKVTVVLGVIFFVLALALTYLLHTSNQILLCVSQGDFSVNDEMGGEQTMIQMPKPFFFEAGPRAIVLLHAYASSANDVRMLGRHLQREGYTVLAPMFTGHATGEPKDILTQGAPATWWQDTQSALQFLRDKGYTQLSIFGLSLGGIFAMRALETDATLLGGGSFSSPVVMTGDNHLLPEFARLATATYQYGGLDQAQIDANVAWLNERVPAQLRQIDAFAGTVADQLAAIQQPVFVAQGGQDELIDAQAVYQLRDRLVNAKTVDFHYYEDAGHVITVNNARHQLEQDLDAYLQTIYN